jgi:hypothetical protein
MSNTDPTKNTTQKTKKMSNTDPTPKTQHRKLKRLTTGSHLNQWDHEWQADCVIFGLKITPKKRF